MMEHDYRDVLLKAASLVEEGWFAFRKSGYFATNGSESECAVTATLVARQSLGAPPEAEAEADEAVRRMLGVEITAVWNDAEGRTADEVADALRRAAE